MEISTLAQEFNFVDTVTLEENESGQIDLKMPHSRYAKADEMPVHQYGWGPFCKFFADTTDYQQVSGVYVFTANYQIVYVGEAVDIHSRIQAGYSNISPRNCFEGGQQTNCRINNAILDVIRNQGQVALWASVTRDRKQREAELIDECDPQWNKERKAAEEEFRADSQAQQEYHGKYSPLKQYLRTVQGEEIEFTFAEIEEILSFSLPKSAHKFDAWWSNGSKSHSRAWLDAGWRVKDFTQSDQIVCFERL
ncbi:GIY-YIG nuclease family protein [Haloarcula laminariae]|uniref:GIY-YIG nuclease family protein n=1 Tax=Haloarcula laminariae TaxID=2961577 RepID=UPI0021C5BCB8|nr:GIY-YIG nuclease family protein [Halomicroarcula laminariae]